MRTAAITLIFVLTLASTASARTWQDTAGNKVEAEYAGFAEGKVKLKMPKTGNISTVPIEMLCKSDQDFVKTQPAVVDDGAEDDRWTAAVRQDPNNPRSHVDRGLARLNRDEYERAMEDFEQALKLDPNNAEAHNGRGMVLAKTDKRIEAHKEFTRAIELDPKMPLAYRNRGENIKHVALSKETVPEIEEFRERYRKKIHHAHQSNQSKTPWQPLNTTSGPVSQISLGNQMAKDDLLIAERLERERHDYRLGGAVHFGGPRWGWGGPGYGWGGYGGGPGGGPGGPGPGPGVIGPGDPPLMLYPASVYQGDTITLVANPATLQEGMPQTIGSRTAYPKGSGPPRTDIDAVDFYRDRDGNAHLTPGTDELLGTDAISGDGFSLEVSTARFPTGKHTFFAMPRGAEGTGTGRPENPTLAKSASLLQQAVQAEQEIARQSKEAAEGSGYPEGAATKLGRAQDRVSQIAQRVAEDVKATNPELAKQLEEAGKPIGACDECLANAESQPGESSKEAAAKAASEAEAAAEMLEKAASSLQEEAMGEDVAKGAPVSGSGEVKPPKTDSGKPAEGSGKGGPGSGEGSGTGGGDGGNGNDDGVDINIDVGDDIDVAVGDDADDGLDVDIDVTDAIDRALDYVDDGDYDRAVGVYDRLVRHDPDNDYYLRGRAGSFLAGGGYDYAIRDYDRLITLVADDAGLYYNRGCAYLAAGELDKALFDFSKSIELNETWSLAYNNRGTTYARLGNYTKAVEDFDAAIRIEPNNHVAFRNRALAYKKLGQIEKAQADFGSAQRLASEK